MIHTHDNYPHMNDTFTFTHSHINYMNDTETSIRDFTNYMHETHTPKHIHYMNGTYKHISHDPPQHTSKYTTLHQQHKTETKY